MALGVSKSTTLYHGVPLSRRCCCASREAQTKGGGSWTHSCPAPKNPRESKTVQDCPRLSERIHSSPCYLGTKAIIVQQPPSVLSCNTNVVISDPFSLVTLCETSDSEEKGDAEDTSTCLREIRRASGVHAFPLTSSALAERISIQCQGR